MNYKENYQQITPNLWLTRKDGIVIDALVDHNEVPIDWHKDQLITFFSKENFYLVFYFSKYDDKGFQMFLVHDFAHNVDDMVILSNTFSELIVKGQTNPMFRKALYRVDHLIHMSNTFRALVAE
jgi:hypothetical protein